MSQHKLPLTTATRIKELRKDGLSHRAIGKILKVSQGTVANVLNDMSYSTPEVTNAQLKDELKELKGELREAQERSARLERMARLGSGLGASQRLLPPWSRRTHSATGSDRAVATAILSDLHLDEVIDPKQVGGVNAYNRVIAGKRLRKFFDSTLQLTFDHFKGIKVEGLVLPMLGDIFSGNIHEELRLSNEATILESILYWSEKLGSGISMLAKEFKSIHIPCTVGNHGRMSHKPIAKNRAQDNFDWLLYHIIARDLKHLKNVTWDISEAADTMHTIYETRFLDTHGDQFRGGGGIAGLLSPLMIGSYRKSKRQQAVNAPYDWMLMGHWHQYSVFKGIVVNGSLCGYNEFCFISNFDFEPPRQAYFLTQPKYGITISGPLHVVGSEERY